MEREENRKCSLCCCRKIKRRPVWMERRRGRERERRFAAEHPLKCET